jgi:hypothetical protein
MPSTEYIERQAAVAIIIPVEEPSLLLPMHRIVSRIKIKNNLVRLLLVRLQEQVDQKPLDGNRIALLCRIRHNSHSGVYSRRP